MPRDTHVEPVIEVVIEAPYRELVAPAYCDDVFKAIPPRTPAAQRFAQASTLAEVLGLALEDLEAVKFGRPGAAYRMQTPPIRAHGSCHPGAAPRNREHRRQISRSASTKTVR